MASNQAQKLVPAWWSLVKDLTLIPAIIVLLVVGTFANPAFLTPANLINVLQQSSALSILVIAQTMILIAGKFDLSMESIVGLAPMFGAWLIVSDTSIGGSGVGLNPYLAILVVLLLGALIGAVNGFLVVRFKLNAFVVTLAMLILLRGLTLGLTNGRTMYGLPPEFLWLGNGRLLGMPISIWVAVVLYLLAGLFLGYHRVGRAIYATGGNPEAARVAGIRVDRVVWGLYIVAGLLAGLAGLMVSGRIASVVTSQGQNMVFYVFAACVIGGISLNGGRGRMAGALSGVVMLGLLQNVLTLGRVAAFWIDACYGAIILGALVISRLSGDKSHD